MPDVEQIVRQVLEDYREELTQQQINLIAAEVARRVQELK